MRQLVALSDDIRRRRRHRIKEIEFERAAVDYRLPDLRRRRGDERLYESDVVYERRRRY